MMPPMSDEARYLEPYLAAIRREGAGFRALLWASAATQAMRFAAIADAMDLSGKSILDAGCGRADLVEFLRARKIEYTHYVGMEAIGPLAEIARQRCGHEREMIVQADFVRDPGRLYMGADVIVFCGSLNTLSVAEFYRSLTHGIEASAEGMVFNFLCSPLLAHAKHLAWHRPSDVIDFLRPLADDLSVSDAYLEGDCTIAVRKTQHP